MRIVPLLLLICFVSLMFVGQTMYSSDKETGATRDIYEQTEESFNWSNYSKAMESAIDNGIESNANIKEYNINVQRVKNVFIKFVDFVGYGTFEMSKFGIEYGYEHPEQDLSFFLKFLIKLFWIILAVALIPLVVPVLAIIYLFFKGMFYVFKKIVGIRDD